MATPDWMAKAFCQTITAGVTDIIEKKRLILAARGLMPEDLPSWADDSIDDLTALFNQDSGARDEVCWFTDLDHATHSFLFGRPCLLPSFQYKMMDPFIARYVRALNSIGIMTYWSCDGNHQRRHNTRMELAFSNRVSLYWHEALYSAHPIFWGRLKWSNFDHSHKPNMSILRITEDNSLGTYLLINQIAHGIEQNRAELLKEKQNCLEGTGARYDFELSQIPELQESFLSYLSTRYPRS